MKGYTTVQKLRQKINITSMSSVSFEVQIQPSQQLQEQNCMKKRYYIVSYRLTGVHDILVVELLLIVT